MIKSSIIIYNLNTVYYSEFLDAYIIVINSFPQDVLFSYLLMFWEAYVPILSLSDFISCRVFVFWLLVGMVSCCFYFHFLKGMEVW